VEAFSTIDDPLSVPVIALTKEVGRGEALIAEGRLLSDWFAHQYAAVGDNVFMGRCDLSDRSPIF